MPPPPQYPLARLAVVATCFIACFAFVACQTKPKAKPKKNNQEQTVEPQNNEGMAEQTPASSQEYKPAESIPEVAQEVKEAAQEYLDARKAESFDDSSSPDAAKIEEVSQALEQAAEAIIATPENEMVENLSDTEGMEALTVGMVQDSPGIQPNAGKALAITGGAIFIVSLGVTLENLRRLGAEIGAINIAELRQYTWHGYSKLIEERATQGIRDIKWVGTQPGEAQALPDKPAKTVEAVYGETGLEDNIKTRIEKFDSFDAYVENFAEERSRNAKADHWSYKEAPDNAKHGTDEGIKLSKQKIKASLLAGEMAWTVGEGESTKSVNAKKLYEDIWGVKRATEGYERAVEAERVRAQQDHKYKTENSANFARESELKAREKKFRMPEKPLTSHTHTTPKNLSEKWQNFRSGVASLPDKAKTNWAEVKEKFKTPEGKLRYSALGGGLAALLGMSILTWGTSQMALADTADEKYPAVRFAEALANAEIDMRAIQVKAQMAAFK